MSELVLKEPVWLRFMRGEIGVKEVPGVLDNARIIDYLRTCHIPDGVVLHDETFWCSALMNFSFRGCGYEGTDSLLARSWLQWGRPIAIPRVGCVVVLRRGEHPWQGHVGLWLGADERYLNILSGNVNNEVNNDWFLQDRVLGYRWPMRLDVMTAALTRRVVWRGGVNDGSMGGFIEGRERAAACYSGLVKKAA